MNVQIVEEYAISEYRVMRSAAGWYVGTHCFDPKMPEAGMNIPWSRDSGYMSKSDAERLLANFIFTEECESTLEQDAVAEYRMGIREEVGLDRAIYDALWVMDSEVLEVAAARVPGRVDEPTVAMPAEQEPYQFELAL